MLIIPEKFLSIGGSIFDVGEEFVKKNRFRTYDILSAKRSYDKVLIGWNETSIEEVSAIVYLTREYVVQYRKREFSSSAMVVFVSEFLKNFPESPQVFVETGGDLKEFMRNHMKCYELSHAWLYYIIEIWSFIGNDIAVEEIYEFIISNDTRYLSVEHVGYIQNNITDKTEDIEYLKTMLKLYLGNYS